MLIESFRGLYECGLIAAKTMRSLQSNKRLPRTVKAVPQSAKSK